MKRQYWCKTDYIFWSLNKFLEVFMCKIYDAIFKTVNWLVSIFHYRNQLEDLIYWHMSCQALKASACMHTAKSLNVLNMYIEIIVKLIWIFKNPIFLIWKISQVLVFHMWPLNENALFLDWRSSWSLSS